VNDGNFIKIDRKILEWEWYKDQNTKVLFLHMLIKANWKEGKFQGTTVPRGSFISSINKLSTETNLTEREVRTAISHLKSTGEVTSKATNKFTVFTVLNYDSYQTSDKQTDNQPPSERHSNDIQTTTIEERKKERREEVKKKKESGPSPNVYFEDDEKLNDVFLDFVEMRKKLKNGAMTERAITMMIKKIKALDRDTAIAQMEQSIVNNWKDLYPLKDNKPVKSTSGKPNQFQNFPQREIDYDALVLQQLQGG
jgi:glutaredoxin